ncbi:MAG: DUF58 domain-containing protein [Candidatus Aenigmarchaeota archaeon]|nr:DUF58 domain-containing protein [Candidatus Aenigmarchaeota archaeon]
MIEVYDLVDEVNKNARGFVELFTYLLKYRILFRGSGLEFAGLREYVPGEDDASRIEWKASLKGQKIYIKQYEEEKDLNIFLLVDTSSSMLFGTQEKLKSEYASILAATIAFAGIEVGDKVGLAMFNDGVVTFHEPSQGQDQYFQIIRSLTDEKNYGGKCNLADALTTMINNVPERTALFIISDFLGCGDFDDQVNMCAAKFNRVFGFMLRDPRDEKIPPGIGYISLLDPYSNTTMTVNADKIRSRFEAEAKEQSKKVEETFVGSGSGFIKIFTNECFADPTIKYLKFIEGY